jgi:hypothetical protein
VLVDDKPKAEIMIPDGVMMDEWCDLAAEGAGWRLEGCDHTIEVVLSNATNSEGVSVPDGAEVDPPWRILFVSFLMLLLIQKGLQEVKRGVSNEGGTDPARGDITGSGLGVPSSRLSPDSNTGHVD